MSVSPDPAYLPGSATREDLNGMKSMGLCSNDGGKKENPRNPWRPSGSGVSIPVLKRRTNPLGPQTEHSTRQNPKQLERAAESGQDGGSMGRGSKNPEVFF